MIEQTTSLIERDNNQALLWSPDDLPPEVVEAESQEGHYTGERLHKQRPHTYRAIVCLLGCGMPIYRISAKLHVHHKTVAAVAILEGGTIAQQKREMAALARQGQRMVFDSLMDDIARGVKMSPKDKAIVFGILCERSEDLDPGAAYEQAENHGSTPGHEEYQEFLDQLTDAERSALTKMGRAAEKRVAKERAAGPVIGSSSAVYDVEDED